MSPSKPGKPAPASESLAVSMNQDEFVAGGLATDFDGTLAEVRTCIWNYDNGSGPKLDDEGNAVYTLAVRGKIVRDDGEDDVIIYWSAGNPAEFVPGIDPTTPAPVDESGCSEGYFFLRNGSKTALNNNTNYAQMLNALKDAEAATPQLAVKRQADVRFLEGLHGHWDRIPQKKRSGIVREDAGQRRQSEVLVCTALSPAPGRATKAPAAPAKAQAQAAAKSAAPSAPAASPTTPASGLDEKLQAIVVEAVTAAGDDGILKGKLAGYVLKSPSLTQPERAKGVPRVTSNDFLEGMMAAELIIFDAESGSLTAWPSAE